MKKILLSSDCNGNLEILFNKVTELYHKNKFDVMFMVGSTCPSSSIQALQKIKKGQIIIPLPTYFIENSDMSAIYAEAYPQGVQIAHNFTFLGRSGIKMIQGLKVCYINGIDGTKYLQSIQQQAQKNVKINNKQNFTQYCQRLQYKGQYFQQQQIQKILKLNKQNSLNSVDILLTNQWPQQFEHPNTIQLSKSTLVSQLCYQLYPKYHIVSGGKSFYRMNPFKTKKNDNINVTHFMNIAEIPLGACQLPKDKYLMAIQIDTLNTSQKQIKNVEQCKFSEKTKQARINTNNLIHGNIIQSQSQQELGRQKFIVNKNKQRIKNIIDKNKNNRISSLDQNSKTLSKNDFIYFEGFPLQTTDRQIHEFLERWGQVKQLSIDKKNNNAFSRKGLCRFKNLFEAQICLADSNRYTLYQSRIKFSIKQQNQKFRVQDCFLCIGNKNFDENLIVYVGKFCYIAVDKGPIDRFHYQIVPINHVSTTRDLQQDQKVEILRIQSMLIQSFNRQKLTVICYERYANLSYQINHCIIHVIAVDMDQTLMLQKFRNNNISHKYNFQQNKTVNMKSNRQSEFYIKLSINNWNFIKILTKKDRDLQISRQIVCEIIQKPEKVNWRDCQLLSEEISLSVQNLTKILKDIQ